MNLTKEEKQRLVFQKALANRIKVNFSTKRIVTLNDYLHALGNSQLDIECKLNYYPNELSEILTFPRLKSLLDDERIKLETELWLKHNPPQLNGDATIFIGEPNVGKTLVAEKAKELIEEKNWNGPHNNYGLVASPKESCTLFWFQKKHAVELLDGILKHDYKAQLLVAEAGRGKTFILGAVLRRLLDTQFHKGKTISPWPMMYITKASVVEQTKRVLEKDFGIDTIREVFVTNYDQLRANLGKLYITEETVVEGGIEYTKIFWKEMIPPCVFIIDESQAAKNEYSIQSQIIQAICRIPTPVYCIFSSATPGTRVSEFKYFCINCRIDI